MSEKDSASNIKGIIFTDQEEKVLGRGRIGKRIERFDPNAIDGDSDGTVQEGSAFERPAGPRNMPKVKPVQVPRPEEVPIKPSTPSRPSTPSKPNEIPQKPKVPASFRERPRPMAAAGGSGEPPTPPDLENSNRNRYDKTNIVDRSKLEDGIRKQRNITGAMGLRKDEKKIGNSLLARLQIEKRRSDSLTPALKRDINGRLNSLEYYAQMLIDGKQGERSINELEADELRDAVDIIKNNSRNMDKRTRNAALDAADVFTGRYDKKNRTSLRGGIGIPGDNKFDKDDENFGEDILSQEDLTELNDLQDQVLDELSDSIVSADDLDNELQQLLSEADNIEDPNDVFRKFSEAVESVDNTDTPWPEGYDMSEWLSSDNTWILPQRYLDAGWEIPDDQKDKLYPKIVSNKKDKQDIEAIQAWLKNHPFNPEARDFQEREWADNEADGQAKRYAPIPWEVSEERKDQIDWDKLLRQANLTAQQKDDWELTDEELKARQALHDDKLGSSGKSKAERAQIWTRVKNGESFREITPDYPDYHWSLVRDMSRMGATESGVSKQQSQAAEQEARSAARERANNAGIERLMENMKNAKDVKDLKRRLRAALDEANEIKKRTSNEYQMMRKKQVERWRLASTLFETMPERKDGESDRDFANRMRDWFFETSPLFEKLAEDINHGHDISTATDRAYEFQNDQISMLEDKISDVQSFWNDIQNIKNGPSGGTSLSGGMGVPRGVKITGKAKAKKVDFREFEAIQTDLAKLNGNSFKSSSVSKRPPNLNKQESAIVSRMRSTKDFPKGFFKPRKKPKKA